MSNYKQNFFNLRRFKFLTILVTLFCLCTFDVARAATLTINPASTSVSAGNILTVKINTNTLGKFINNAEAVLQFPTDLLEVVSVSKNPSIFSLWVVDPTYSNAQGTVSFNGGVANPGYNGTSGGIISITFKAKKSGTASLILSDAAVRENDGLGTDILTSKGSSTIQIIGVKNIETPVPVEVTVQKNTAPAKPVVFSNTHPDQDQWYSLDSASFNWKVPSGVTSIQAQTNKTPEYTPAISYDTSVTQKTLSDLADGTFYFHIRYKGSGKWSPVTDYKIRVDTTAPDAFTPVVNIVDNQSAITLDAQDRTSGIDHYSLVIDGGAPIVVNKKDIISSTYTLPPQKEGDHTVVVTAYDKAGNSTQAVANFVSSAISIPTIELPTKDIKKNDSVIITGTSEYVSKQVEITLEQNGKILKTYTQIVSTDGTFSITTDSLKDLGVVTISARNVLTSSVKSLSSKKLYLNVNNTDVAKVSITLAWAIAIAGLIVLLLIILYTGWYKLLAFRKRNKKEIEDVIKETHKAVSLLKESLGDELVKLEKIKIDRKLNKGEEAAFKQIKKSIDDIDKFIDDKLSKLL